MSFGDFIQIENNGTSTVWERVPLGNTSGRSEAWLRDILQNTPALLPVNEIDASYGPLIPLCTELQTPAGPIDNVFISPTGKLTLVECKLWRNPESRRKVIAQLLDYARTIVRWSYSDLQRQVSARLGKPGNQVYELVKAVHPQIEEHRFADMVASALANGRFLLLIAGDGIREDVEAISELINRNATLGFSFGIIEVALFNGPDNSLLVQPRALARTKNVEHTVIVVRDRNQIHLDESVSELASVGGEPGSANAEKQKIWWSSVIENKFDDPDQSELRYYYPNNVRAQLPMPGIWITAYTMAGATPKTGVFLSGRRSLLDSLSQLLEPFHDRLQRELPEGSYFDINKMPAISRPVNSFSNEEKMKAWLFQTLNTFVNTLRPIVSEIAQNN